MRGKGIFNNIDWICAFTYFALVVIGWFCIYAITYSEGETKLFDLSSFHSKQFIFILSSVFLIVIILSLEDKIYQRFSSLFYGISIILLLGLFVVGKRVNGATAWYSIGSMTIQPAEFAKVATALVFSKELSRVQVDLKKIPDVLRLCLIISVPCVLIMLQPDPGSVLVYASFFLVMFREGLSLVFLFIGFLCTLLFISTLKFSLVVTMVFVSLLLTTYGYFYRKKTKKIPYGNIFLLFFMSLSVCLSTSFVYNNVFKQHHRDRFSLWLNLDDNTTNRLTIQRTVGYNTHQSVSAISSGGVTGKGFLEGTRTKGGFVPEQHTDYIFTVVGEEWGFIGTSVVVLLFSLLLLRVWYLSEKQRNVFTRIYGYCVVSILFVHFFVNIGMVIGLLPTIGIPLPFFSYGGSSLWGFTILLFVFLKLEASGR